MKFLVVTKSTFETEESRFYQDGTRASYLHQVGNLLEGETWYENGIRQTVFKRSQNWENYSYTMDVEVNYYFPAGEFDQKRTFRYNGVLVERQPGETSLAASDDAAPITLKQSTTSTASYDNHTNRHAIAPQALSNGLMEDLAGNC